MIVTIIQSCIHRKHEVCRTINPEIGADVYSVVHIRIYKNIKRLRIYESHIFELRIKT